MSHIVRIVSTSMGIFDESMPPSNIGSSSEEKNLAIAESLLKTAANYEPDLVLLPELFSLAGCPGKLLHDYSQAIGGSTEEMVRYHAQKGRFNLVSGHLTSEGGKIYNQALIHDRSGNLVGVYKKNYPIENEIVRGVTPGNTIPTFNLDIGKIGVAICFDVNWLNVWQTFTDAKVDLVCWISAFDGGLLLRHIPFLYRFPIISSVSTFHSRLIDIDNTVLASTTRWDRMFYYELNLDRNLYHVDLQMDKIAKLRQKLGKDVTIRSYTEGGLFMVSNNRTDCTIKDIEAEFGLVTYADYISRCNLFRNQYVEK